MAYNTKNPMKTYKCVWRIIKKKNYFIVKSVYLININVLT